MEGRVWRRKLHVEGLICKLMVEYTLEEWDRKLDRLNGC